MRRAWWLVLAIACGGAEVVAPPAEVAQIPSDAPSPPRVAEAPDATPPAANVPDAGKPVQAASEVDAGDNGNMFGDQIGEAFGAGGLGLTGVGKGGGGSGGTIGLGGIGTGVGPGYDAGTRSGPSIRQGMTTVNGRLPPEVIQRIVRQNFGRFRLCYENGLRTNPKLGGQVVVRFTIDKSGAVAKTEQAGTNLPDAGVASCVERGFGNLSFPAPEGGIVVVTYPVIFNPP